MAPTTVEGLYLLPAGRNCAGVGKEPAGESMRDTIGSLSESYDMVLIDAQPVACWTQPDAIAPHCDGTILVGTAEQIDNGTIGDIALRLQRSGATVVGAIVTITKHAGRGPVTWDAAHHQVVVDDIGPAGPDCYDFTVSWTCP